MRTPNPTSKRGLMPKRPRHTNNAKSVFTCVGYQALEYSDPDDAESYRLVKGRYLYGPEIQDCLMMGYLVPGAIYERRQDGAKFMVTGHPLARQYFQPLDGQPSPEPNSIQERMF